MEKVQFYKKEDKENLKEKFDELLEQFLSFQSRYAQIHSKDIKKISKVDIDILNNQERRIKNNLLEIAKNLETRKSFKEFIKEKRREIVRIYEDALITEDPIIYILEKKLENLTNLEEKFDLIVFSLEKKQ
jgi:hypothetical protein